MKHDPVPPQESEKVENEDEISYIVEIALRDVFPPPNYSNKSEAKYFDNGEIRARLAGHPVTYEESDADVVIGIGKNAGADSDLWFKSGEHSKNEIKNKIKDAIKTATDAYRKRRAEEEEEEKV